MFLYLSTSDNKLSVVQVEEETGNLIKIVQTIEPIVDPLPTNAKPTGMFKPVTEWVETHPKFPLLYVFTSFWNQHPAYVTTYRIHKLNGSLEKLGVCETGGHHAAHATFSPDGSTLCVAHYMDGNMSFFDCSQDKCLEPPIKVVELPEVIPHTRSMDFPGNLPALHHVQYGPNGTYLLASDASAQGRVWTYPVDEHGLLTSETPIYKGKYPPIRSFPSLVSRMFTSLLCKSPYRIRRTVVHPNGRYAYLLFESHAVIQVYEISTDGKLSGDCLQELPSTDEAFANSKMPIGAAFNAPAELVATEEGVWASNRGWEVWGRAESSIHHFGYEEDGTRLVHLQVLPVAGPVRHFIQHKSKVYSGVNSETPGLVETFTKQEDGIYQKVGQAAVGMDVMCIAIKE
jgi:6-phosphogluconolactonase (cycloisomerase 2 family)